MIIEFDFRMRYLEGFTSCLQRIAAIRERECERPHIDKIPAEVFIRVARFVDARRSR
jgi:hypothetical protein